MNGPVPLISFTGSKPPFMLSSGMTQKFSGQFSVSSTSASGNASVIFTVDASTAVSETTDEALLAEFATSARYFPLDDHFSQLFCTSSAFNARPLVGARSSQVTPFLRWKM